MRMIKEALRRGVRALGVNITSTQRFGVDFDLDLARLTSNAPIRTIFDVGGNFGQTALRFASAFPASKVFTFEPVPASFDCLQKAVKHRKCIKAFNTALGDKSGTIAMNLTPSAGTNTILQNRSATGSVEVRIDTIDAFANANAIETIDLLKVDVEGYELQVLRGAQRLLGQKRVRYIFAECVLSLDTELPHTSLFDLHQILEHHGFCFVNYYGESFSLRHGSALGNALYALRSKLPEKARGRVLNIH